MATFSPQKLFRPLAQSGGHFHAARVGRGSSAAAHGPGVKPVLTPNGNPAVIEIGRRQAAVFLHAIDSPLVHGIAFRYRRLAQIFFGFVLVAWSRATFLLLFVSSLDTEEENRADCLATEIKSFCRLQRSKVFVGDKHP